LPIGLNTVALLRYLPNTYDWNSEVLCVDDFQLRQKTHFYAGIESQMSTQNT